MEKDNRKVVKILFRFFSDVLDEEIVETMWATIVDEKEGLYKLDNIPFYAPLVASEDIVLAEFDKDEDILTYRKTVKYSGNSIIQVVLLDKSKDINEVRNIFKELGCRSEQINGGYFSMEVPVSLDYKEIKFKLEVLKEKEVIDYAEPCLGDGHSQ